MPRWLARQRQIASLQLRSVRLWLTVLAGYAAIVLVSAHWGWAWGLIPLTAAFTAFQLVNAIVIGPELRQREREERFEAWSDREGR